MIDVKFYAHSMLICDQKIWTLNNNNNDNKNGEKMTALKLWITSI